jgi:regulation of enolase protein 1 (concanavalin A-like superfamily)
MRGLWVSRLQAFKINLIRADIMQLVEKFLKSSIPKTFYWFNEPAKYQLGTGLEIFTDEKTDFWQTTHYGFQRDDGQNWLQLRITHLHKASEQFEVGVYACSPIGKDFWCRFKLLEISRNEWFYEGE